MYDDQVFAVYEPAKWLSLTKRGGPLWFLSNNYCLTLARTLASKGMTERFSQQSSGKLAQKNPPTREKWTAKMTTKKKGHSPWLCMSAFRYSVPRRRFCVRPSTGLAICSLKLLPRCSATNVAVTHVQKGIMRRLHIQPIKMNLPLHRAPLSLNDGVRLILYVWEVTLSFTLLMGSA